MFFQNYSPKKLKRKWESRVKSVLIPYLIWNFIAYLYYEFLTIIPGISGQINMHIEPFSLKWAIRNMVFGYHNITWFLQNLMAYIIIAPLLYPIIKRKKLSIIILGLLYLYVVITNSSWIGYGGLYLSGAILGIHFKDKVKALGSYLIVPLIYICISVELIHCLNVDIGGFYFVLRLTQVAAIWFLADIFAISVEPKWWMKISFFIYCTHSMILESLEKVFLIVFGKTEFGAILDIILAPILTLVIIIFVAWIFKHWGRLWKVLTGTRGNDKNIEKSRNDFL